MSEEVKLKSCNCGHTPLVSIENNKRWIKCNCGMGCGPFYGNTGELERAWNTRATDGKIVIDREELNGIANKLFCYQCSDYDSKKHCTCEDRANFLAHIDENKESL